MLVRDPIEVPFDPLDVVAPLADRRPKRLSADRPTTCESATGRRSVRPPTVQAVDSVRLTENPPL